MNNLRRKTDPERLALLEQRADIKDERDMVVDRKLSRIERTIWLWSGGIAVLLLLLNYGVIDLRNLSPRGAMAAEVGSR